MVNFGKKLTEFTEDELFGTFSITWLSESHVIVRHSVLLFEMLKILKIENSSTPSATILKNMA